MSRRSASASIVRPKGRPQPIASPRKREEAIGAILTRQRALDRHRPVRPEHFPREVERAADQHARRALPDGIVEGGQGGLEFGCVAVASPTVAAIAATSSAGRAATWAGIGTATTSRARPAKLRRKPSGSFVDEHADDRARAARRCAPEIGHGLGENAAAIDVVAAVEPDLGCRAAQRRQARRCVRRCRRAGHSTVAQCRVSIAAVADGEAGRARSAAMAMPALSIWWRPARRGSGRSRSPSSSW